MMKTEDLSGYCSQMIAVMRHVLRSAGDSYAYAGLPTRNSDFFSSAKLCVSIAEP